jgi:hypothetical protein
MQTQTPIRLDGREFTYNKRLNRYRYLDSGRLLSQSAVESLTRKRIDTIKGDLGTLNDLLVQRKLSLESWQQATAQTLKELHVENLLLGKGGLGNTTNLDYLTVGRQLKEEYQYLRGVADDLTQGKMTEAQFRARMNLYANKGRVSFEAGKQQARIESGLKSMRRRQGATHRSCADCIKYAAQGWQPIGSLPLPTVACECGPNCNCWVEYSELRPEDLSDRLPA